MRFQTIITILILIAVSAVLAYAEIQRRHYVHSAADSIEETIGGAVRQVVPEGKTSG